MELIAIVAIFLLGLAAFISVLPNSKIFTIIKTPIYRSSRNSSTDGFYKSGNNSDESASSSIAHLDPTKTEYYTSPIGDHYRNIND